MNALRLVAATVILPLLHCSSDNGVYDARVDAPRESMAGESPLPDASRSGEAFLDVFVPPDGLKVCADPTGDTDHDGISNGTEGCQIARDSDSDSVPDWLDWDSDSDGISDKIEAGQKDAAGKCAGAAPPKNSWPCDTDGDGIPDYMDVDSDGDGYKDGYEDKNGDGLLGCCISLCGKPGPKQLTCPLTKDGCGTGQTCSSGTCTPAALVDCANGETDPKDKNSP